MEITFISSRDSHMKGLFVDLNRDEALRLAISLIGQVRTKNPNTEREEFYPKANKKCNYFTIGVKPEPPPLNLYKIMQEITEEVWDAIPEGKTPHKRGIIKGIDKVHRILRSKLWSNLGQS